jgi:hypothetical protein
MTTDPQPTPEVTTLWGEDFVKMYPHLAGTKFNRLSFRFVSPTPDQKTLAEYEIGLRFDGVVVWREVKP